MKTIVVLSSRMSPLGAARLADRHAWPQQVAAFIETVARPAVVVSYPPFMDTVRTVMRAVVEAQSLEGRRLAMEVYRKWLDEDVDPLLTHPNLSRTGKPFLAPARVDGATLSLAMLEHVLVRLLDLYHSRLSERLRCTCYAHLGGLLVDPKVGEVFWWERGRREPGQALLVSGSELTSTPVDSFSHARNPVPDTFLLPAGDWSVAAAAAKRFSDAEVIHVGYEPAVPLALARLLPLETRNRVHLLSE